jgi:hypothetical protein
MGSNVTTYGNEGGALVYTFTAASGAGSDSGPVALQAKTFTKWAVCLTGTGTLTTCGVYILGTLDNATANGVVTGAAASWFPLAAGSVETTADSFYWSNPLTVSTTGVAPTGGGAAITNTTTSVLYISLPLVAIRGVILGATPTLSGTLNLVVYTQP